MKQIFETSIKGHLVTLVFELNHLDKISVSVQKCFLTIRNQTFLAKDKKNCLLEKKAITGKNSGLFYKFQYFWALRTSFGAIYDSIRTWDLFHTTPGAVSR
ncbi:hypothetical protein Gasu2_22590 [Galdieria sulphuraria]|nr:hypothetical protein Gasu2_22590 [Galdieria sulphuraria]